MKFFATYKTTLSITGLESASEWIEEKTLDKAIEEAKKRAKERGDSWHVVSVHAIKIVIVIVN